MTEKRALAVAATLLESDEWSFSSTLGNDDMMLYGTGDLDYSGALTVKWEVVFDVRDWGIKDLSVQVNNVHLNLEGEDPETYEMTTLDVNWPQPARPPGNIEAPTEELAIHMAQPQWKVSWKLVASQERDWISIAPRHAEIDLTRHTIEIEF